MPTKKKESVPRRDGSSPKKSRMKEAKETRLLFETIAKKLLTECTSTTNHKLEEFCTDIINKKFTELRQDVVIMESSLSTRIAQVEHKVNEMGTKLADLTTDLARQNTLLREDHAKLVQQTTDGLEAERQKRLALAKKVQTVIDTHSEQCKSFASAGNKECMSAITSLNEDFRVHSKELTRLKESVEDVLLKRYGFVPGTTHKVRGEDLASTFNQGLDAGVILDNLASRLKTLESHFAEEEWESEPGRGPDSPFARRNGNSSPLRSLAGGRTLSQQGGANANKALMSHKVRRLEESIYDLRAQLQVCESEIGEVKSTVIAKLRNLPGGVGSPQRGGFGGIERSFFDHGDAYGNGNGHGNNGDRNGDGAKSTAQEVRSLQKKLKKLAENTTRACRSLSSSVSDVQQATLNLYSWTDSAYDAFGKVSHELGLKGNVCVRARVYHPPARDAVVGDLFQD